MVPKGFRIITTPSRTTLSMISQLVGAIVNIILDPIFIFGYCGEALSGTTGAALATVIGQFCGAGVSFYLNLRKNPDIQLDFKGFRPSAEAIKRIYVVGLPSIAMQCVGSVMTFLMNQILMAFTATAVAVFGVYFKLQSFVFMPIFGMNNGMVPIIGYNYGARKPDRVKKTIKCAMFYAEAIMLVGFLLFQFLPDKLLGLFSASEAMLAIGKPALRIICFHFLLAGMSIILSSTVQALGNGMFSLIISVCRQLVVLLPAAEVYGVECMIGCMLEAKISVNAAVELACAKKIITKIDLDGPVLCSEDHILGGAVFNEKNITVSDAPGMGIQGFVPGKVSYLD